MFVRATLALALLVSGSLTLAASPQNHPFSFNNLTGSSDKSEVISQFPEAYAKNRCRKGEQFFDIGSGSLLCEALNVTGFNLDGQDFNITFLFNYDGSLRHVSVQKSFGVFGGGGLDGVDRYTIVSTFRSLSDLLRTRYGQPVEFPLPDDPNGMSLKLEWQPNGPTKWQPGGDRVSLSATLAESRRRPGTFTGDVTIFYTFERRAEASRL